MRDVELFTYTCSTASRVAMLAAGFHVARGRNAGEKAETTIACSILESATARGRDILGDHWLAKWERSAAKFPLDLQNDERAAFEHLIRARPQFGAALSKNIPSADNEVADEQKILCSGQRDSS